MLGGRDGAGEGTGKSPAKSKSRALPVLVGARGHAAKMEQVLQVPQPQAHRDQSRSALLALHVLCHDADLDPKNTSLLFGGSPLQAHVSTRKLHGELHLDLQETGVSPSSPAHHLHITRGHSTAPGKGLPSNKGAVCPHSPTYPVHLNHIHVPVLCLHGLRVQL